MGVFGVWSRSGRWWLGGLVGLALFVPVGASVVGADDVPDECFVWGSSLRQTRSLYSETCTLPRIDCDRIDGVWYCSSRVIGGAAPGGVSADDVGASGVGGTTVVAMGPSTTVASTTVAPTTLLPPSLPSTAVQPPTLPSTAVPPSTLPSTSVPPSTVVSSTVPPPTGGGGESDLERRTYGKTDGPERNPMKGWNSGWWTDRQETTVGFQYIKWKDLEPRNGEFDFSAVENLIDRPGSSGRHVILRLYCDWWGAEEASDGCPEWIYSQVGVARIKGDNGRYITDYNDPRYVDEAVQAIQALGQRYDDDPRIYAFQLGVIGYWGEWHTYGSRVGGGSYEITDATKTRVLNAYTGAFDRVMLMGRYPYRPVLDTATGIGFHNDYFRPNNGHSAEFDLSVFAGEKWQQGPIGGEVPPGLSSGDYREMYATPQGREMIETGHYSTMKPGAVDGSYLDEHMALHKRFGYNYQIEEARFATSRPRSGSLPVELRVTNIGIAPFYYDWQVQFALVDGSGTASAVTEADAHDLRRHQPGEAFPLSADIPLGGAAPGRYRLVVRILQPDADRAKAAAWKLDARNTYILFANDLPVIDGSWNGNNQLVGGWSVLGEVEVG